MSQDLASSVLTQKSLTDGPHLQKYATLRREGAFAIRRNTVKSAKDDCGETVAVPKDYVAIAAYGGMLSSSFLFRVLGRCIHQPPIRADLRGWRRVWNATMPNVRGVSGLLASRRIVPDRLVYLNLRPAPLTTAINVLVWIVHRDELHCLDAEETTYVREIVNERLIGATVLGDVFAYRSRPEWLLASEPYHEQAVVLHSYYRKVANAVHALGRQFESRFWQTTDVVPNRLILRDL